MQKQKEKNASMFFFVQTKVMPTSSSSPAYGCTAPLRRAKNTRWAYTKIRLSSIDAEWRQLEGIGTSTALSRGGFSCGCERCEHAACHHRQKKCRMLLQVHDALPWYFTVINRSTWFGNQILTSLAHLMLHSIRRSADLCFQVSSEYSINQCFLIDSWINYLMS